MTKEKFNDELMELIVDKANEYWDVNFSDWLHEKNDFITDLTNDFWNDHVIYPAHDHFKDKWDPTDIEDSDFSEFFESEMEPAVSSYFNRLDVDTVTNNLLIYAYNRGITDQFGEQPYL